jgi:hypothetical protein
VSGFDTAGPYGPEAPPRQAARIARAGYICTVRNVALTIEKGAKFCDGCGAQLLVQCPSCGTLARAGARFCCDSCGAALLTPVTTADSTNRTPLAGGQRRHLTVLFCDRVNSTSLAAQLDPEEWREIVADYHRAAAQAIERFGGHVAQYLGDGVMAYFGYPEAHDNDAERAVRAALAILDAVSKLSQPSIRPELSARIGIDSRYGGRRRERRQGRRRIRRYA